jgi:phenylalanyl-tRNA synthetase beta chain
MLISLKWLEELLDTKLETNNLRRICLNQGIEVEEELKRAPEGIIIGKVNNISPHPKLKKLDVLEVKTDKTIHIVTAAKNIKKGDLVLVGPAGTELHGQQILKRDFEGITSHGILISEQELGLAEKSLGVIVLEKGRPGSSFTSIFDDVVLDMSTTPNRPDWLSVDGIARTLAVGLGLDYTKGDTLYRLKQFNRTGNFTIKIQDIHGCPRYTARIFEDVVVTDSPFWMKWRLHCMGMKTVNNVVDITNIVMLLTGQPLHPFDLDLLRGGIFIRRARAGEKFVTLEGTVVKLNQDDVVIADRDDVIALAGVIGAKRSQISNATKRVLLESAYFDPRRIAHTSRRLDLITEASVRFEQGGDMWAVDGASVMTSDRFKTYAQAEEIEFIGVGKKGKIKTIRLSIPRLNEILSLHLSKNEIKSILKKIGVSVNGTKTLIAKVPHYRRDLQIEEDMYEEVAKVYGYKNIPETFPKKWAGAVSINKNLFREESIKNYLIGQGFSETYNLSLISSKRLSDYGLKKFVKIKNPLNERFDALRPTLFFGLLDCVNYNLSKGNRSLKLFEMGNILIPESPFQETRLGIIMGGRRYPSFWSKENEQIDYFDTKGVIEGLFDFVHLKDISFRTTTKEGLKQAVMILCSGKQLGYLGLIEETFCKESYFYIEMALEPMWSFVSEPFYIPPAKFPANTRDLSFLVDEKIEVPDMIDVIAKVSGPILEKIHLFDYYKGNNLPPGKKSLGFRLYFRAQDRTLTDKEVDSFIKRIAGDVVRKFRADLRTKEQNWTN